ncbi:MAG: metallophosphoesterase family protein [Bacteroidota bacterium]
MQLGILSDIHEDVAKLKIAIRQLEKSNCDEIICLGDIVGFSHFYEEFIEQRDANECISIIKSNCKIVVAGNHDLHAIKKLPNYKAGIKYPKNWYELDYPEKVKLHYGKIWLYDDEIGSKIDKKNLEFLNSLKEYEIARYDGNRFLFTHFLYPDLSGATTKHLKKLKDVDGHFNFMKDKNCLIGFAGHGHFEGIALTVTNKLKFCSFGNRRLNNELQCIVLPGIVSGNKKSGYLIFDTKSFELDVIELT